MPTIAAVSKFTLQTRQKADELGTKIKIDGGKLQDSHEIGCKVGTTVLVEDLFFNTPARLKFLKSTPTEANKIHDFIVKLAISRPEITFRLINGNRIALSTPGNGILIDTISAIYGTELIDSLLTLKRDDENLKVFGFVSKPNVMKSYRSWQTFIINGRVVENRTISKAVDESYKSLIPKTGFPLAILNLNVPQNSIDVNVHPQKTEIKFEDEGKIFRAVYHAVRAAVEDKNEKFLNEIAEKPEIPHYEQINLIEDVKEMPKPEKKSVQQENPRDDFDFEESLARIEENKKFPPEKLPQPEKISSKPEKIVQQNNLELEPIGQVARCYILAQSENTLYIIDQHAAHERILFDRLSNYAEKIPAQGLLIHRVLKFDSREADLIEKNLQIFADLGFSMEPSGENEFRLTEMPLDAADTDPENLLREIISEILSGISDADDIAKKIRQSALATTACKAAIKAGLELNTRQIEILLNELAKTPHPHTCPHGRPTIIKFSSGDLAKK